MKLKYSLQIVTMQNIEQKKRGIDISNRWFNLPRFGDTWPFLDQNVETLDPFKASWNIFSDIIAL